MKQSQTLKELMMVVVDHYITRWEPIGSKFLHSLEHTDYAPSTLRKYLNILEQDGLLYQPYNSAGRIPTCKGMEDYLESVLDEIGQENQSQRDEHFDQDLVYSRDDLRNIVKTLGEYVDGAVVGFIREDEYYYLWLDNLLKDTFMDDVTTVRYLVKFIESRELVQQLDARVIRNGKIYYSVLEHEGKLISIIYTKILINGFDAIISVVGSSRVDHKRNITILMKLIEHQIGQMWLESF